MSGHDNAHQEAHHAEPRSKTAFTASFWFVIILVGLFIAALNFINVMGNEEEEGHGGETKQEMTTPANPEKDAASSSEHADAQPAKDAATTPATVDSAHH